MQASAAPKRRLPTVLAAAVALALAAIVLGHVLSSSSHRRGHAADALRTAGAPADPSAPGADDPSDPSARGAGAPADPSTRNGAATPVLLPTPAPRGTPVSVSLAPRPLGAAVPADFLGLSFETRDLPAIASFATKGDLATLLRSLGPGVMRFGGVSADEQVAWVGSGASKPSWASATIDEDDLAGLAMLARKTGWKVLLTVNLGHLETAAAAQEAAAARAHLGRYLAGIEIGNEPDLFPLKHLRPPGTGVRAYLPQAAAYRAAIEASAPGVPIAGPDPSTGLQGLTWVRDTARALHPQLLTDHYYPLSSCGERPTISELLSPEVRRKENETLAKMLAIAHAYKTPLRMDETNDISCEGEPGVSDSFASALWALDWTARAMSAGVVGINFHDLIAQPSSYSALAAHSASALAAGELRPAPEWYALLAAHALASAGARPLPLAVTGATATATELSAFALRAPDGTVRIALIDYDPPGSPPLAVQLRAPRSLAGGAILRLNGPSPAATTGTRLGGRAVAANGAWTEPSALPAVHGRPGSLALQLAPGSAAVATLTPRQRRGRAAAAR